MQSEYITRLKRPTVKKEEPVTEIVLGTLLEKSGTALYKTGKALRTGRELKAYG